MFPSRARLAAAVALAALAVLPAAHARAQDKEPEFDGKNVSEWISISRTSESARQRAIALDALVKIWTASKHKDTLPAVCYVLQMDKSEAVRAKAATVLAGLRPEDGKYVTEALIAALAAEKASRVRKEIITAMVKFPTSCVLGVEPLTAALKDPEPGVKIAAAEALALAGEKANTAAPELVPLLKSPDQSVRRAAVYALARIKPEGGTTIAETMAGMLAAETDPDMKRELITAMGLLAEKTAPVVQALTTALTEKDDGVRRRAARVLGTFGRAAEPAADALFTVFTTDKDSGIRVDAVHAFSTAVGPAGIKARVKDLLPRLDPKAEPAFEVRLAVVDVIGSLGYEHLGEDLMSADPKVKQAALDIMAELRKSGADPKIEVRIAANEAVRKITTKPQPKDPNPKPEQ